jgi:hypothetical protein
MKTTRENAQFIQITNTNKKHSSRKMNYPRVIYTTDIHFAQNEMQLLRKRLKYNLHYKNKNWLEILVLEAEPQ